MNKQYGWLLVAALGLAGCGGGGGGGGETGGGNSQLPPPPDVLTVDELTGSWVRSKIVWDINGLWKHTEHDTIVITRTGSSTVRLRDCVDNDAKSWTLEGKTLKREGETSLGILEKDGRIRMGVDIHGAEDRVTYIYERLNPVVEPKFAGGSLSADLTAYQFQGSTFDESCVSTYLTPDDETKIYIRVKGMPEYPEAVIKLAYHFDGPLQQMHTYVYRHDEEIDGATIEAEASISFLSAASLRNPYGDMTVSRNDDLVSLEMDDIVFDLNSSLADEPLARVNGTISFRSFWLQGEPTRTD